MKKNFMRKKFSIKLTAMTMAAMTMMSSLPVTAYAADPTPVDNVVCTIIHENGTHDSYTSIEDALKAIVDGDELDLTQKESFNIGSTVNAEFKIDLGDTDSSVTEDNVDYHLVSHKDGTYSYAKLKYDEATIEWPESLDALKSNNYEVKVIYTDSSSSSKDKETDFKTENEVATQVSYLPATCEVKGSAEYQITLNENAEATDASSTTKSYKIDKATNHTYKVVGSVDADSIAWVMEDGTVKVKRRNGQPVYTAVEGKEVTVRCIEDNKEYSGDDVRFYFTKDEEKSTAATCTKEGVTYYNYTVQVKIDDEWKNTTCTGTKTCVEPAIAHSYTKQLDPEYGLLTYHSDYIEFKTADDTWTTDITKAAVVEVEKHGSVKSVLTYRVKYQCENCTDTTFIEGTINADKKESVTAADGSCSVAYTFEDAKLGKYYYKLGTVTQDTYASHNLYAVNINNAVWNVDAETGDVTCKVEMKCATTGDNDTYTVTYHSGEGVDTETDKYDAICVNDKDSSFTEDDETVIAKQYAINVPVMSGNKTSVNIWPETITHSFAYKYEATKIVWSEDSKQATVTFVCKDADIPSEYETVEVKSTMSKTENADGTDTYTATLAKYNGYAVDLTKLTDYDAAKTIYDLSNATVSVESKDQKGNVVDWADDQGTALKTTGEAGETTTSLVVKIRGQVVPSNLYKAKLLTTTKRNSDGEFSYNVKLIGLSSEAENAVDEKYAYGTKFLEDVFTSKNFADFGDATVTVAGAKDEQGVYTYTYDGNKHAFTLKPENADSDAVVEYAISTDGKTYSNYSTSMNIPEDAGTYYVKCKVSDGKHAFRTTEYGAYTVKVAKRDITVTSNLHTLDDAAKVVEKTYGDADDSVITYTVSGAVASDNIKFVTAEHSENVGTYVVAPEIADECKAVYEKNYNAADLSGLGSTLVINKRTATIVMNNYTKTYDGKEVTAGNIPYSVLGLADGDTKADLNLELAADGTMLNAGTYHVYANANNKNYDVKTVEATVTINKANQVITVKPAQVSVGVAQLAKASKSIKLVVTGNQGKVTFTTVSTCGCKKVSQKNGVITLGKGMTVPVKHAITMKVTVPGNQNYNAYSATKTVNIVITKSNQTFTVSNRGKTLTASNLKKAARSFTLVTKGNVGKVTYKKASGSSAISISSKGVVTVKKGTKKGTYYAYVTVTAAATSSYNKTASKQLVKVVVK